MSEAEVITKVVQQPVKRGDKPTARTLTDLQDTTRQDLSLARSKYKSAGPRPIFVHNTGGETIPAHSPAEIVGRDADTGTNVDRPTAANLQPSMVLFTKENAIASGADGFMYSAFDEQLEAQTDATGVLGSSYGTQEDSFELIVDGSGFVCLGEGDAEAIMRPAAFPSVNVDPDTLVDGDILMYDETTGTWVNRGTEEAVMVTDMRYDTTTKRLQKKTWEIIIIPQLDESGDPTEESAWTLITGGQAVEET